MKNLIEKINNLSEKRINFYENNDDKGFYKWNKTYIDSMIWEIEEVKAEIKDNNSVHLEDELWDVFWTYICLLNSLKEEWLITSVEKVFERSYKKFSWRINEIDWTNNWEWSEVKKCQKESLELEKLNLKK